MHARGHLPTRSRLACLLNRFGLLRKPRIELVGVDVVPLVYLPWFATVAGLLERDHDVFDQDPLDARLAEDVVRFREPVALLDRLLERAAALVEDAAPLLLLLAVPLEPARDPLFLPVGAVRHEPRTDVDRRNHRRHRVDVARDRVLGDAILVLLGLRFRVVRVVEALEQEHPVERAAEFLLCVLNVLDR